MKEPSIYLDYAAATPLDPAVLRAMEPYFTDQFYNPSSPYLPAVAVRGAYEEAKSTIARAIGAKGNELIITAGATESINIAFHSTEGHRVIIATEHQSILETARQYDTTIVGVKADGSFDVDDIVSAIRPDTQLISVSFANSELGTIHPLRKVAKAVQEERRTRLESGNTTPIWFHSDASQGFSVHDINVARLGVDMLTLNAGKIYGPKQVGALWSAPHVTLKTLVYGGGQEGSIRSGTENVAGTIGFAKAVELATKRRATAAETQRKLRDLLEATLCKAWPQAVVSGDKKHQLVNFLHISFPNIDAERLIFLLEAKKVYVATGSACAANKRTRSHVLEAIGLSPAVADGSLRITIGKDITEQHIIAAATAINDAVREEYNRMGASAR